MNEHNVLFTKIIPWTNSSVFQSMINELECSTFNFYNQPYILTFPTKIRNPE